MMTSRPNGTNTSQAGDWIRGLALDRKVLLLDDLDIYIHTGAHQEVSARVAIDR
jgi:hypothetical protein